MISELIPKDELIQDVKLLEKVVKFKQKFYQRGWAQYDLAKPGTLRLVPDKYRLKELEKDYKSMQDMLFGEKPTFDYIIQSLEKLEKQINKLDME